MNRKNILIVTLTSIVLLTIVIKQQNHNSTLKRNQILQKAQPTPTVSFTKEMSSCEIKKKLVDATFKHISKKDKENFQQFLKDYQIKDSERDYAALLYFYPNGFVLPGKKGMDTTYIKAMLQFRPFWYLPADNNATEQTYFSSFFNFSITAPIEWRLIPFILRNIGFISPETRDTPGAEFRFNDEGFDVFIFEFREDEKGQFKSLNEFANEAQTWESRQYPFRLIKGPENVSFGQWSNVLKLTWSAPASAFPEPLVGNGKAIMIEDYLIKEGETYFQIYFRYSDAMEKEHRQTAEKIAFSFKPTLVFDCKNLPHSYSDELFQNVPGGGSRYNRSKTSLPENQFR